MVRAEHHTCSPPVYLPWKGVGGSVVLPDTSALLRERLGGKLSLHPEKRLRLILFGDSCLMWPKVASKSLSIWIGYELWSSRLYLSSAVIMGVCHHTCLP